MKLTTERKIYLALLGLGLLVLGVSQFSFGSSAPAQDPAEMLVRQPKDISAVAAAPDIRPAVSVAERLRAFSRTHLAPGGNCLDAFQTLHAPEPTATPAVVAPAVSFQQGHRLQAVVMAGPRSHAIINGRLITLGQSIDGYRLVEVKPRSGVLQSAKERVELRMVQPSELADVR
jgi:hypothetical protein